MFFIVLSYFFLVLFISFNLYLIIFIYLTVPWWCPNKPEETRMSKIWFISSFLLRNWPTVTGGTSAGDLLHRLTLVIVGTVVVIGNWWRLKVTQRLQNSSDYEPVVPVLMELHVKCRLVSILILKIIQSFHIFTVWIRNDLHKARWRYILWEHSIFAKLNVRGRSTAREF